MDAILRFRQDKDQFFESSPHSPLSDDLRENFKGLNYFDVDPALRLEIQVLPYSEPEMVKLQTTTGDWNDYQKYGLLHFEVAGVELELTLFLDRNGGAFLPFADATTGEETYGAGRYLEPEELEKDLYLVDFNLAYNPWCAYSPFFSCPLPPSENRLQVPIEAGEKDFGLY